MATAQMDTVIRQLRRAVLRQDAAGKTDGQLLTSFIDHKDEAAFEALVCRHGPMVFGVCRRVVRNHHDAEDAFQATFLVLAHKASSVRPRDRVANWLHGVALRTAMKANAMKAKRLGREKQVTEMPELAAARQDQWHDLQPLLDQELNGLPEKYRLPILLCDLEGKSIKEATQQLGWPQGTLAGRLARGRKLLAKRLTNRGVALSAGSLAAVVSQNAVSAGVPTSLMSSTLKAATLIAVGQATVVGMVPAKVAALTEGVMKSMMLTKLSKAVAGLVVLSVVVFGGGLLTHRSLAGHQTKSEQDGDNPAIGRSAPLKRDAGTVAAAGAKHNTAKTDLDRLQGVWSVVSIEQGGKPSKLKKEVFMVDGKRACWQTSDSEMQGGLYLEPTSKPKTFDFVMSTRTMEGIYALDGDNLRLCYDIGTEAKRPVSFTTEKGSRQVLIVLKRTHGPEVFPCILPDGTRAFPTVIEKKAKTPAPIKTATTPPPLPAPRPKANKLNTYNNDSEEKKPRLNGDNEGLQGTWKLVIGSLGEYPDVPGIGLAENLKNTDIVIDGDGWTGWTMQGKKEKTTFRVDATRTPKALNIKDRAGKDALGIYMLGKDDLVICICGGNKQERPSRFVIDRSALSFLIYKQIRSKDRVRARPTKKDAAQIEIDTWLDKYYQALGLSKAQVDNPNAEKKDELQGGWILVSCEQDGKTVSKEKQKLWTEGLEQIIFLGRFCTQVRETKEPTKKAHIQMEYTTDPSKDPKWIDLSPPKGQAPAGFDVNSLKWIYAVEKDELRIGLCTETLERPTAFGMARTSLILTFRRMKPAEKAPAKTGRVAD